MTQSYYYQPFLTTNLGHHYGYLMPILDKILPSSDSSIKVLDLGCGNGSFTHYLSQKGFDVLGVDPSESGVALAQQHFPKEKFIQGDIYNFPLDQITCKFDYIISIDVIEHLYLLGLCLRSPSNV